MFSVRGWLNRACAPWTQRRTALLGFPRGEPASQLRRGSLCAAQCSVHQGAIAALLGVARGPPAGPRDPVGVYFGNSPNTPCASTLLLP